MPDLQAEPPAPRAPTAPPHALIDAELARLAASSLFRRSPRHVRFLRHLVQCTLDGQTARLREVALGVEVFLRSAARFDPRQDTIVRVEARRLRQKLQRYYADDGAAARIEFVLPTGRYEVELRRREAPSQPRASVAVFDPLRAADADAALHALLGTELPAALTRLNGLRVVRAGAGPEGGDAAALQHARKRLQVDHLVTGTLTAADAGALLDLQLRRCADGSTVWARRALLGPGQALQGLETLARGIVAALHRDAAQRQLQRIRLAGPPPLLRGLADGGPTVDGLDKLGLARVALREHGLDACRKAVRLAEQATQLMPGHAPAWALLAEALIASVGLTAVPSLPALHAAREAAERALALDPELPDALGQMGFLLVVHQRDWPAAEARLLQALRAAPAAAPAHARYGWSLMMHGRFDEARACYAEARDLDPLSLQYRVHDALVLLYQRDWPRSEAALDAVLDVSPGQLPALSLKAALLLYSGRLDAGLQAYRTLHERLPALTIGRCGMAQALALRGDADAARTELQHLLAAHAAGQGSPYQVAMVQARLGDLEATLRWLDEAARGVDFNYVCVGVDPAFDTLRTQPGFAQLLRRTGFAHLAVG